MNILLVSGNWMYKMDMEGKLNIRRMILVLAVLSFLSVPVLYFLPVSTNADPGKPGGNTGGNTSGNITFTDSAGNPLSGIIAAGADAGIHFNALSSKSLAVDALKTKNVAVEFENANVTGEAQVILEDYGSKNPVRVPLPGRAVKYVEIGADNISFSSASITIGYSDAELNGGNARDLVIYHWNGASWDAVPTIIDAANRTLSAAATSLSPWGVAAQYIYYLENNATPQSVGADGNINHTDPGNNIPAIPYKNLLKYGTMSINPDAIFYTTTSTTAEYEVFRFYLPFNYSIDTRISANTSFNISWEGADPDNNRINVSLIDYNPASGNKTVIGSTSFNATTKAPKSYWFQINHSEYTIPQGSRLMFQINTTTGSPGQVGLIFNNYISNITVNEYALAGSISGYVTNRSSGLPVSGASVRTNTSLSNTTDGTGFYYLFPVGNGTYMVNASRTGYAANSTNVTVSGGDVTSANLSLSPIPTYRLSGYVTNASSGAPVPGASVAANTSQTTTTDADGSYNFTLSSGTYLITAKKTGYIDNSTTIEVNGAAVAGANISLAPIGGGQNCISCHDVYGSGAPEDKRINASIIKRGVHGNLNSNATNSTPIDALNKACWACHGDGSEPGGHPSNFNNPWSCTDCHNRTAIFNSSNSTLINDITRKKVAEHIQFNYYEHISSTRNNSAVNCTFCHNMSLLAFNDTASININSSVSHYASNISPVISTNCNICHKNASNARQYYANLTRHPAKTQDVWYCKYCHNTTNATSLHSQGLYFTYGLTASVHYDFDWEEDDWNESMGNVPRDNLGRSSEGCVSCHNDLRNISYKNCENCHLPDGNSLFTGPFTSNMRLNHSINESIPRAYSHTNYSGVNVPDQCPPDPNNIISTCYGFGANASCHGVSYQNRNSAGGYFAYNYLNEGNVSWEHMYHYTNTIDKLPDTTNCLFCHNQSSDTIRKAWGNATQLNRDNMFGADTDESCYSCHTTDNSVPKDFHAITVVKGGGPGCLGCHNISNPQKYIRKYGYVDAENYSHSIHALINSENASGYGINASCWACHNSSGTPVANNTHPDRRDTPYICTDCHLAGGRNAGAFNAAIVSEHFINGTGIKTSNASSNITSCIACHNKSEMLVANNDTDMGSFDADGDGTKGGNLNIYHYGRSRSSDLRTGNDTNCSYCHQNTSTAFATAMINPEYSSSIANHSLRYNSSNPGCTSPQCHNTGWIHNSSLTIPALALPNSTFCLSCHGDNGTGGTNFSGMVTGVRSMHNNSVNCTQCHLNESRSIHPVKYLQQDGSSWDTSRTNAVNCTTCHQGTLSGFSTAPIIPATLKHSNNPSNGSLWNSTSTPFWTSEDGACYYCHNNTKHNATALGSINSLLSQNNTRNGTLTITTWCADCHYNTSNPNYKGSQWSQAPPLITFDNTGKTYWVNHSDFLGGGYKDSNCKPCHPLLNGSYLETSLNYSHSLSAGLAGPDCISCHDIGRTGANHRINSSVMNLSNAIHARLNENAANSTWVSGENRKCWGCHDSTGSQPGNDSMGSRYNNPYKCYDCHNATGKPYSNVGSAPNVSEHFMSGEIKAANASDNSSSCIVCHNKSEMNLSYTEDDVYNSSYSLVSHYGRMRPDLRLWDSGQSVNCSYCHQNASTAFTTAMINPAYNSSITNHSLRYNNSNPSCTSSQCHNTGWIHNSTLTIPSLELPNSTFCLSCHGNNGTGGTNFSGMATGVRSMHNNSVNCTQCHLNESRSIHPVRYLQQDGSSWDTSRTNAVNCTTCHQGTGLVNFTDAPLIPDLKHSNNPSNGSLWNSTSMPFWTSEDGACYYCHNNTKHNATALGSINSLLSQNNTRNGTVTITTWCADCHYNTSNPNYKGDLWTQAPPLITINNTGKSNWADHSQYLIGGYKDSNCKPCHPMIGSYLETSLNYSHSLSAGQAGPDCISCHDIGSSAARHWINSSVMNLSNAIHARLNENAANSTWVSGENRKCWGCHDSTGSQPGNDSMGSRYNNPYKCYDCHNATGKPYSSVSNALNVSQHFMSGEIKAANASDNSSSCIVCHIKSEMNLSYTEGDAFNSSYSLVSHYGRKRPDLRLWDSGQSVNCSYCHQNASTAFTTAMINPAYNSSITNHSLRYNNSNPSCTSSQCHNTGWIHNSTLTIPSLALPNSTFCLSCHGNNGTGITNFSGVVTGVRSMHNNSVNCTQCHLNESRNIHPVGYLQQDLSWNISRTNAVNCTTCHQSALSGFSSAPLIPATLMHSNNASNGSLWNNTPTPFWTSEDGACYYCHDNTKHNASALGSISSLLSPNNTRNGTLTITTWCADCHYNTSNPNYKGSQWSQSPPLITINNTGKSNWVNHSDFLVGGYKDSNCKPCHPLNGSYLETSLNYSHSLSVGLAGPDCISCHDYGSSIAQHKINNSVMNQSDAIHARLNENAANSSWVSGENRKCWGCHDSTGSQPGNDSMGSRYNNPYKCYDCHNETGKPYSSVSSALNVSEHFMSGEIKAANASDNSSSCLVCHIKSEMNLSYTEDDVYNSSYSLVSHYGMKRPDLRVWDSGQSVNCSYCHQNASTAFATAMIDPEYSSSVSNHSLRYDSSNPGCTDSKCHGTGWIHNSTLTKPSLTLPNSTFCLSCHGDNGSGGTKYSGMVTGVREKHNNTVNCTECHLNTSKDIHPVKYLQPNAIYNTSNSTAVNCTTCHQTPAVDSRMTVTPPKIPTPMNHSTNKYSGGLWNGSQPEFWDNTSQRSACEYCHGRFVLHNISALGNISKVKGSNTLKQDLSNSTWCASCHYANASNGTSFFPEPPEILNLSGKVPARARDNTSFYNHSRDVAKYNDSNCQNCHNNGLKEGATSLNFSHNVAPGGGGPDCISCHDINVNKLREEKRIIAASMRLGVHGNLNSNATNSTAIDALNKACWACHLEGNEPVGEHYNTPARRCDDNDCHSIEQSYRAPMVYSHFKDADLNSNPERALNYNVSTSTSCYACHNNSLSTSYGTFNASVSHYASKQNLIDTKNCIYCHLDKDNAEKWGNATEINKNRSAMIEMDREKNKFTAYAGEFTDLGLGYRIKVADISDKRGSALIELYKENTLLDSGLVNIGNYTYEETRIINNASSKIPVIVLNITAMFVSDKESFIQFEGFRIKRVHSENRTTSCYLCHFKGGTEKHKYTVIDRVDDDIYYTEVFFNSSDINEYDQQQALQILANKTPSDAYTDIERAKRKTLKAGEKWKLDENYSVTLEDISTNSDSAKFLLEAGSKSFTDIVKKGEILEHELSINYLGYTSTNTTVFSARVSEILQPSIVVLEDIYAISPEITKVKDNTSVYGYNASWMWENNTFMTGPIPSSLHTPLLYDGKDGGAACLSCHNIGELGFHEDVNSAAAGSVASANKACWACHGEGKEPKWHPANYQNPRNCKSCHVEKTGITYNATFIGDEKHGALVNCERCHVEDTHRIIRFDVVPDIRKLSISKEKVQAGEKIEISATASAGYEMRLRGAEYYVDSPDKTIPMSALDGSFDDRVEDLTAELNTTGLETGNHSIYVRAMERNNKWGPVSSISISVGEEGAAGSGGTSARTLLLITGSTVISVLLVRFVLQRLASGKKPNE